MGNKVRITLADQGWSFEAGPDDTVLAAAERAQIVLPSSCRNGTCRTCLCQASSGAVTYRVEWPGLSIDEKRAGWILPCVALARADLTLVAPAARRRPLPGEDADKLIQKTDTSAEAAP